MARRRPPIRRARPGALVALAALFLAGCADLHRGVEAVGRVGGGAPAAADVADDPVGTVRPAVKTVRPRGAPRAPAADTGAVERAPIAVSSAVPTPQQIFDFHPPGAKPDSWRQPFVIDTSDGPLAADVRRSSAELEAYRTDTARAARTDTAKPDGVPTGTARLRCGEAEVATGKPGCAVPRPRAADAGTPTP